MATFLLLILSGVSLGSFLNVLIDRLSCGESLSGRSHCDYCKYQLKAKDLVPVVSFLLLKGKCRKCKKSISWQYPLVEILTAVVFVLTWYYGSSVSVVYRFLNLAVVSCCIVIFFADLKYHIIPDEMLIALTLLSLPLLKYSHLIFNIYGAILGFALFYLIYKLGKGNVMGFGDVKYAALIGFVHGPIKGFISFYIAFIIGGIVGLILLLTGRRGMKSAIAFGPFLTIGFLGVFFWGEYLMNVVFSWIPIEVLLYLPR